MKKIIQFCKCFTKKEQTITMSFLGMFVHLYLPLSTAFEEEANMGFEVSPCKHLFSHQNAKHTMQKQSRNAKSDVAAALESNSVYVELQYIL